METPITTLLGIRHPIIQGGLQGLGRAELAAAVSNAGGLGTITAGCFETSGELREEIALCRSLTDAPFAVNISIGSRKDMMPFLRCALDSEAGIIITSGNNPGPLVETIKSSGAIWIHVAPAVRYAKKAEALGADAVTLVGFEAGGHPGLDDIALSVLVRHAVAEIRVPIIAAGGISDGSSVVAALAWGASGVQMGSRFVMTRECPLHEAVKSELLKADVRDTVVIERSLRKARRVLKTNRAQDVLDLEKLGADYGQIKHIVGGDAYLKTILEGDLHSGVLSTGQVIGLIDSVPPAQEVVNEIMDEVQATASRLKRYCAA